MSNRIAVYMICKDEFNFIERAIQSVKQADEIVVCDTGSKDGTYEKLLSLRETFQNLKVFQIFISPWRFDDARNSALGLVSQDINLCISLDADEVLDSKSISYLQSSNEFPNFSHINHSFMTYWNWDKPNDQPVITKHFHERIHSRFGFRWIHPVHEKLVCQYETNVLWITDILMSQYPDTSKDRNSYYRLLEQAVIEDPGDWKLWSFLANEYISHGDYLEAEHALYKSYECQGSDKIFLLWLRASLAYKNGDSMKAEMLYNEATSKAPNLREAWLKKADFYYDLGDREQEKISLKKALKCLSETQGYHRDERAWNGSIEQRIGHL
jgi:glycosyltransferase involved in cell wall biosynthesis